MLKKNLSIFTQYIARCAEIKEHNIDLKTLPN
jgi:hypothetical protein